MNISKQFFATSKSDFALKKTGLKGCFKGLLGTKINLTQILYDKFN